MTANRGHTEGAGIVRHRSRLRKADHAEAPSSAVAAPKPKPVPSLGAPRVRRGFDILLTDAPGVRSSFLAPAPVAKAALRLARRPRTVARRLGGLAAELGATAAGVSERSPRLPASVDTSKFTVGENLAATPGSVVNRTEVFELIQYAPSTEAVREVPMMIVPPTINKYYAWDLSPGRSIVEWFVAQGMQVFTLSWRNPTAEQADFSLDTYADACVEAGRVVQEITGTDSLHVAAACSGGQIAAATVGHLVATERLGHVASLGLFVCALDRPEEGVIGGLTTREAAAASVTASAAKGYVDGRALAQIFAWLRPNDMIWNYWVNNYLLGAPPPAFDILYWNQDSIRMAAGLHADMIEVAVENSTRIPGALTVLGTQIDLAAADVPTYVLAGETDHIVPWENAYRGTQMLGGTPRFVLVDSGHIQALVNPPDPGSRRKYRVADAVPPSPEAWLVESAEHNGSWWPDYLECLEPRSGGLKPKPTTLGSKQHKPIANAPGIYIFET